MIQIQGHTSIRRAEIAIETTAVAFITLSEPRCSIRFIFTAGLLAQSR